MNNSINPTERAIMELVREMTIQQLSKRVPAIDTIENRRLTYFLIEVRRAAYIEKGAKRTLISVLHEFSVQKCDTYYEWRLKWHHLLPSNVKNLIK